MLTCVIFDIIVHRRYSLNTTTAGIASWSNPADVEFVYENAWAEPRCTVESVGPAAPPSNKTQITMKQPCFWNLVKGNPMAIGNHTPAYVENVREHLTTPGEWYYDNAKQEVLYYPLEGQDMSKVEAIVAVEETLVKHVEVRMSVFLFFPFSCLVFLFLLVENNISPLSLSFSLLTLHCTALHYT